MAKDPGKLARNIERATRDRVQAERDARRSPSPRTQARLDRAQAAERNAERDVWR